MRDSHTIANTMIVSANSVSNMIDTSSIEYNISMNTIFLTPTDEQEVAMIIKALKPSYSA
jgi:hypothetical protein